MKKHLFYILFSFFAFGFLLSAFSSKAQQLKLGSNPTQIEKSAVLELASPNQGLLLTRVPDFTKMASTTIPDGMIVYYTDNPHNSSYNGAGLYIRKDGVWKKLVAEDKNGIETINGDGTKDQTFTVINGNSYNNPNPPTYHEPTIVNDLAGNHILYLPYASNGFDGLVSNNLQTWVGNKRFKNQVGIESLSPGSVPFIGPDDYNYLLEDNGNFYWDDANNRLGIGTNAPSNTLTVDAGTAANQSGLTLTQLKSTSPVTSGAAPIGVDANGKVVKALEYYNGGINTTLEKNQITKIWEAEVYNTSDGTASGASTTTTKGLITITIPGAIGFNNIINIQVTAKGGTTTEKLLGGYTTNQSIASVYSYDQVNNILTIRCFRFKADATLLGLLQAFTFKPDDNTSNTIYIRIEGN